MDSEQLIKQHPTSIRSAGPSARPAALVAMVAVLAMIMSLVAAVPATALGSVPGGPVILDGNDPADHGSSVNVYMQAVYTNLNSNLAAGYVHNGKVAVIGSCSGTLTTAGITETFVTVNSAADVESLFVNIGSNNYKHIHICSDEDSTLSSSVEIELDKWGAGIAQHVNRGGGLFSTGHSYNWLNDLFPSLTVNTGGSSSSYVTADGATFFASLSENNQLNAINHYTFADVGTTSLSPLLSEYVDGAGRVIAIGGTTVRFPQISITGPTTGEVGAEKVFTLVAADADGTPLSSNSFTWTITGPTTAAGTGSAVTDSSGEYQFTFSGNAKGQTQITVQMTLGSGESAGSAITTTWATVPDAPTITSAVNVSGQDGSVLVSWNAGDNGGKAITDYVIEFRTSGGAWTGFDDGVSTTTSATVTGLTNGVSLDFRVAAVNPVGQSAWSTFATGTPIGSPAAPTWVGFDPGDGSFDVTWNAPASNNGSAITEYVVQYSLRGANTWTTLSPNPTGTTDSVTGVANATWYDVRVAAVNANGQGAWSPLLEAIALTVPGPVVNFQVVAGNGEVRIEWESPDFDGGSPVTGFNITGPSSSSCVPEHWHPEGAHAGHSWRCTITGLTNGAEVTYFVSAVNARGEGASSNASGTPEAAAVVFVAPVCSVPNPTGVSLVGGFTDVTRGYQISPVEWARQHGLVRGDGVDSFDPDGLVPRTVMAVLLWRSFDMPSASQVHQFNDTATFAPLDWAAEEGHLVGIGGGAYAPTRAATRAEWITVLWRATCEPTVGISNPFTDVTAGWQIPAVLWGLNSGVTTGTTPTTFDPDRPITRGEAVAMLVRWIKSFD